MSVAFMGALGGLLVIPVLAAWRGGLSFTAAQVGLFVVAPVGCAVGLGLLGHRRPGVRANVLLAAVVTAATLFTIELVMTFVPLRDASAVIRGPDAGVDWDGRPTMVIVREARARGEELVPRLAGAELRRLRARSTAGDSLQPVAPSPSRSRVILCNETGVPIYYQSDEYGFNNPRGAWDVSPIEVVLIGDSYTHGSCVTAEQHFSGILRRAAPALLNLGATGAGPVAELAILREYAASKAPAHVFWVYFEGNDRYDLAQENLHPILGRYRDDPTFRQNLQIRQPEIDRTLLAWVDSILAMEGPLVRATLAERVRSAIGIAFLRRLSGVGVPFPNQDPPALNFPEILQAAARDVRAWGGEIHLVYLPSYLRYHAWLGEGARGRSAVLAAAEDLAIPVVDLVPVFDATPRPRSLWTHPDGHLTAEGSRLVGRQLVTALRSGTGGIRGR